MKLGLRLGLVAIGCLGVAIGANLGGAAIGKEITKNNIYKEQANIITALIAKTKPDAFTKMEAKIGELNTTTKKIYDFKYFNDSITHFNDSISYVRTIQKESFEKGRESILKLFKEGKLDSIKIALDKLK